jgi:hypothetical protein
MGYAGWVGDRVCAIEPAGGASPLRGGAGFKNAKLSTGTYPLFLEVLKKLERVKQKRAFATN